MESKEIKKVVCGKSALLILKSNGELHSSGSMEVNGFGEEIEGLNLLMKDENIKDVFCGSNFSLILMKSGHIFAFGENNYG